MRSSPRWLIFLIDLSLITLAFVFTYWVRFNFDVHFPWSKMAGQIPWVVLLAALSFALFKPYRGVVRHTGAEDIRIIILSNGLTAGLMLLGTWYARATHSAGFLNFPYSVTFIYFLLASIFMIAARIFYKSYYYKILRQAQKPYKVLIYGTDNNAIRLLEFLRNNDKFKFLVEGFIRPPGNEIHKQRIQGVAVYPYKSISEDWLVKKNIDLLLLTTDVSNPLRTLKELDVFVSAGVEIKTLPPVEKWLENALNIDQWQSLDMEALLSRKPIRIDDHGIREMLKGKTVLVTGGAGSIGSALVRQIIHHNPGKLLILDQAETPLYTLKTDLLAQGFENFETILADINDTDFIRRILQTHRPHYIFHAAAYKHVPVIEEEPYYGILVNVFATRNLMQAAVECGVEKFIQISTDKAVNPTNIMGATKRIAELMARCMQEQSTKTQFIVTRFGNVLGSNGSVIHLFKKQIQNGGPVTVTDPDITRYFMTIPEAAHLVLKAAEDGSGGKIFVFDMGEPVRIFDLAVKMIRLAGKRYPEDIEIKFIGLRPGEKKYEELLTSAEKVERTSHEKLYISKLSPLDCDDFRKKLHYLEQADWTDRKALMELLSDIIPEYRASKLTKSGVG